MNETRVSRPVSGIAKAQRRFSALISLRQNSLQNDDPPTLADILSSYDVLTSICSSIHHSDLLSLLLASKGMNMVIRRTADVTQLANRTCGSKRNFHCLRCSNITICHVHKSL